MNLNEAQAIADQLVAAMEAHCDRVVVAGSIRRRAPQVKDIEIVALPRVHEEHVPEGLFGDTRLERINQLHRWATSKACPVQWIKPGVTDIVPWAPKPDGKYWRGMLHGIKVDVFLPRPKDWGICLLVRTGCAEYSHAVATHALRVKCKLDSGGLLYHDCPIEVREEVDAFRRLKLEWLEPWDRTLDAAEELLHRGQAPETTIVDDAVEAAATLIRGGMPFFAARDEAAAEYGVDVEEVHSGLSRRSGHSQTWQKEPLTPAPPTP